MRGRLIGDRIRTYAAPDQFGKHFGRVAQQADGDRLAALTCVLDQVQRVV